VKQVVQPLSGGDVKVVDVPRPVITSTEVLVQTIASIISPGTERSVASLAQAGLVGKARARPDLVRQIANKAKQEGIAQTIRSVRGRLDEDLPLGYSAVGIAREVGAAVAGISPGQRVATAGAGKANHAEFQAVPGLLCSVVPEGLSTDDAAFATIASIALHGFRLADVGPGARVAVLGLGLVGQLAVRIARSAGCDVAGIDVADFPVEIASRDGGLAFKEAGDRTTEAIMTWSRGMGVDAVLVTAGGKSSDAIMRVPSICRDRASVVVVGDVGLDLQRAPFYEKELTLRFARSYGPGRYEHTYEEWGVDYPPGFVRWTEGRNLAAVLNLMASGRLAVSDLITHRFPIDSASEAYEVVLHPAEPVLGIKLEYPDTPPEEEPLAIRPRRKGVGMGIGLIGAGSFARSVLVPGLQAAGFDRFVSVASATGVSARKLADRVGFEKVVSGADAVISDPDVEVVVIATRHDTHAALTAAALRAGKHVFCEKPLALTLDELDDVEIAHAESEGVLFVGFNRRWSEAVRLVQEHIGTPQPRLVITYRVNAGPVAESHWYRDRRQGGRLIGEVCHFIDTCAAIVGEPASDVATLTSGPEELLLANDLVVVLRYPNGSLATISYAAHGSPAMEKERIDVIGGGRSGSIVDYKQIVLDGKAKKLQGQDKGHNVQLKAFHAAILGGMQPALHQLESSRTTLLAALNGSPAP
jgi:predicted dehydrogenase/threonine dehydrogenase-like Zn-dependent dehydrogenase